MARNCPNCGNQVNDNESFCSYCGTSFNDANNNANTNNTQGGQGGRGLIQKREVWMVVLLSIVTCGIYGIYWFIMATEDANNISGDHKTSGGMAFLLTIVTCGIYGIYWYWKMGQKLYQAGQRYGVAISDNSVMYLILSLLGFGIVAECLIQNDLNKFAA